MLKVQSSCINWLLFSLFPITSFLVGSDVLIHKWVLNHLLLDVFVWRMPIWDHHGCPDASNSTRDWPNHVVEELVSIYYEYIWVKWWTDYWSRFLYKNWLIRLAKTTVFDERRWDWHITLLTNAKLSSETRRRRQTLRYRLPSLFKLVGLRGYPLGRDCVADHSRVWRNEVILYHCA